MSEQTLRTIGELLGSIRPAGSFAVRGTAAAGDLAVTVDGVGPLRWPVTPEQARELRDVARLARFGQGEHTLLDPNVRNTWEVPRDRITVDEPRWQQTLGPMLDVVRRDLGLPADCELTAQRHSLLVYEAGQFFRRHQDSEKADGMIGTLVVTLPSAFAGGDLVVEHGSERVIGTGSPDDLGFIAFYADCDHEVLPVTDGYRITLTYNLIAGNRAVPNTDSPDGDVSATLAAHLREHFARPVPVPAWLRNGGPASKPPAQLVYLLDHQYSQRGFGWEQLKGADAARAAALIAAADHAECEAALVLAEIQKSYACEYFEDEDWMCGRRRRWELVDGTWTLVGETWAPIDDEEEPFEDESDSDSPPKDHPDRLSPDSLDEQWGSNIELTWWIDRSGSASPMTARVTDDEMCTGTTGADQQPFAVETEGYLGNEGNTVDRWYRRAALVVRPAAQGVRDKD
ncbi:2OG-Fe(II) oxygenase [Nocardia sp. NPDC006630]|uniref:2OG-Fe(II) oxygenase n=1 Tax=Nocardia sp. NPDC006630 TaxID=3157181 RepID=UPI0033B4184A